jgi:hypothetical protein
MEDLRRKVQSCSGRGRRAALPRVDRLIALAIERPVTAMDVGRQGHVSECIKASIEVRNGREAQRPFAAIAGGHNLCLKSGTAGVGEFKPISHPQLAPRSYQCIPLPGVDLFGQQDFDASGCRLILVRAASSDSKQARGYHTRIIQHQNIACAKLLGEMREDIVLPFPGRAIQQEHARLAALLRGLLRNQFCGQGEIEL